MIVTVFLADDHALVRDGMRVLIEGKPDMRVIGEADNGWDAVQKIEMLRPSVAIIDIAMPFLNGIEVAEKLRSLRPPVKILVVSMFSTSEFVVRAFSAGATGYLVKTSAGAELITAIRTVSLGRRYVCEGIPREMLSEYLAEQCSCEKKSPLMSLTCREREILQLVVEGESSAQIARSLLISPKTVDTYRSRLMHKLCVSDITGLVKFAVQHGLTTPN